MIDFEFARINVKAMFCSYVAVLYIYWDREGWHILPSSKFLTQTQRSSTAAVRALCSNFVLWK